MKTEITKAKFTDPGDCLEYFKKQVCGVEVHPVDEDTWEAPFHEQYDHEDISISVSGLISETGYMVDNGNDLTSDWERTGITIYNFEINAYINGELVADFEINGMGPGEIENLLIAAL